MSTDDAMRRGFLAPTFSHFPFSKVVQPQLIVKVRADISCTVAVRGYTKNATFEFKHEHTGNRTQTTENFPIADFPVEVEVSSINSGVNRGQIYASVELSFGGFPASTLISGYVTDDYRPSYPPRYIESSTSGRGLTLTWTQTDPAAGAEAVITVPANAAWIVYYAKVTLVTDATVSNRGVAWSIDDGVTEVARIPHAVNHGASTTALYTIGQGPMVQNSWNNLNYIGGLTPIMLPPGSRISTVTTNLQPGDNYGAPTLFVEEFLVED